LQAAQSFRYKLPREWGHIAKVDRQLGLSMPVWKQSASLERSADSIHEDLTFLTAPIGLTLPA
jgi:hypothetical protein